MLPIVGPADLDASGNIWAEAGWISECQVAACVFDTARGLDRVNAAEWRQGRGIPSGKPARSATARHTRPRQRVGCTVNKCAANPGALYVDRHKCFEAVVKTNLSFLPEIHGNCLHLHMVKPIGVQT